MFKLYLESTGEETIIYGSTVNKDGYPMFLVRENGQWRYKSAKHFITEDERKKTYYTIFERTHGVIL